jgi:hypothetical protein
MTCNLIIIVVFNVEWMYLNLCEIMKGCVGVIWKLYTNLKVNRP